MPCFAHTPSAPSAILIVMSIVCTALASCHTSKSTAKGADLTIPLVELETGACFGFCPIYKLTVYPDGRAVYTGKQFVEREGEFAFQLTPEELKSLKKTVTDVNLWQYPERIPSQIADAPGATLRVFNEDGPKSVSGSIDRPKPLLELEEQIKAIGSAHGLELRRGVNPRDPARANRREVIVLLDDAANAGNWITRFDDLKLQLVRRLGEPNQWVVAYDAGQITEAQLIERFKSTPEVKTVQPNRSTQERNK